MNITTYALLKTENEKTSVIKVSYDKNELAKIIEHDALIFIEDNWCDYEFLVKQAIMANCNSLGIARRIKKDFSTDRKEIYVAMRDRLEDYKKKEDKLGSIEIMSVGKKVMYELVKITPDVVEKYREPLGKFKEEAIKRYDDLYVDLNAIDRKLDDLEAERKELTEEIADNRMYIDILSNPNNVINVK